MCWLLKMMTAYASNMILFTIKMKHEQRRYESQRACEFGFVRTMRVEFTRRCEHVSMQDFVWRHKESLYQNENRKKIV